MTRHKQESIELIARAAERLTQALSETNARGAVSGVDERMVVVLAPRNGVTVVRANVPAAAAGYAVSRGLARWEDDNGARRLILTDEGRAHARRQAAPAGADAFRAQHSPIAMRALEKGAAPVLCNEGESPLAWLARRKDRSGRAFLEPVQVEAGERLRRDIAQAQILQRVTANWEAPISSSRRADAASAHVTETAIDARARISRAFDAVGPDLAGLLIDVCGYLKGLETVEAERGWPARSGKVVLKIALERLARHYGLMSEAKGPVRSRAVLHWGAPDYRPEISPAEA